jgi:hypothetical protein
VFHSYHKAGTFLCHKRRRLTRLIVSSRRLPCGRSPQAAFRTKKCDSSAPEQHARYAPFHLMDIGCDPLQKLRKEDIDAPAHKRSLLARRASRPCGSAATQATHRLRELLVCDYGCSRWPQVLQISPPSLIVQGADSAHNCWDVLCRERRHALLCSGLLRLGLDTVSFLNAHALLLVLLLEHARKCTSRQAHLRQRHALCACDPQPSVTR